MAKRLLNDFRLGGDIIDQVAGAEVPSPNSGGPSPESRPTGDGADQKAAPVAEGHRRDGLFEVFKLGEVTYRVGGVKPLFVTSLRVNIRVSNDGGSYYDSLDLYMARARTGFALAVGRSFGVEAARVEKDLVVILETLEANRDRQLAEGSKKPERELSAADRQAGLELLRDPALFDRIDADLSALGYVGEKLNKWLLYLCASSRKLDDPISILILSQSASGKSFLVDCVKKLMPPDEVVAVTSLSDQALNYIDDLMHKFLVLGEAVHGDVVEHQIREMLSGKELSRLVTVKDQETVKMASRVMRTPVIVASVMSGTSHNINPENASRAFVINTDESRDQTKAIHQHQRTKYSLGRVNASAEVAAIVRAHQAAQKLLEKVAIVNEFAPLLDFPTNLMRLRRDHDRFLDLIACVAYLRQYQKSSQQSGGTRYVTCDLEDYKVAYRIMVDGVLASTLREMPKGAQILHEELLKLAKREATRQKLAVHEVTLTQRMIREGTQLGQTWIKENLRTLVEFEYLNVNRGGGERTKGFYKLRDESAMDRADLSMIPSPEEMAFKLKEARA